MSLVRRFHFLLFNRHQKHQRRLISAINTKFIQNEQKFVNVLQRFILWIWNVSQLVLKLVATVNLRRIITMIKDVSFSSQYQISNVVCEIIFIWRTTLGDDFGRLKGIPVKCYSIINTPALIDRLNSP
jgi:hypothetical protein